MRFWKVIAPNLPFFSEHRPTQPDCKHCMFGCLYFPLFTSTCACCGWLWHLTLSGKRNQDKTHALLRECRRSSRSSPPQDYIEYSENLCLHPAASALPHHIAVFSHCPTPTCVHRSQSLDLLTVQCVAAAFLNLPFSCTALVHPCFQRQNWTHTDFMRSVIKATFVQVANRGTKTIYGPGQLRNPIADSATLTPHMVPDSGVPLFAAKQFLYLSAFKK